MILLLLVLYLCGMQIEPAKEQMPPVTKWLLITNIAVFIVCFALGKLQIDISDIFSLHYYQSSLFKPWQILTHMFMHGDIGSPKANFNESFMHLFSNMFGLWMFGGIIENYIGSKRFFWYYILCGLGAALCHMLVLHYEFHTLKTAIDTYSANATYADFTKFMKQYLPANEFFNNYVNAWRDDPMNLNFAIKSKEILNDYYNIIINQGTVGASGAIFGILLAFGFLFPNVILLVGLFIPLKAKYMVFIYGALELYLGYSHSAGDNIAHFAHLGGLITGLMLLLLWRIKRSKYY